jgi:hypothetical protein
MITQQGRQVDEEQAGGSELVCRGEVKTCTLKKPFVVGRTLQHSEECVRCSEKWDRLAHIACVVTPTKAKHLVSWLPWESCIAILLI